MSLIELNLQPSDRQLRQFGVISLATLPALGWLFGGGTTVIAALALIGSILALVGMVVPKTLKPIFVALMIVTTPIGIVIGELAMVAIYVGVFWPFSLVFRIAKRDALQRKIDNTQDSYWEPKEQPVNVASYYRQS